MEAVGMILLMVLLAVLTASLTAFLAVWLVIRHLRRKNRVSPDARSVAPTAWMASPAAGARLHRRLRTAVRVARTASDLAPTDQLAELTRQLEQEAVGLDQRIVVAAGVAGKQGKAGMATLAQEVQRVEQAASHISLLAAQAQSPLSPVDQRTAVEQLNQQLDALHQAQREVDEVQAAAGVHRVSPYATESPYSTDGHAAGGNRPGADLTKPAVGRRSRRPSGQSGTAASSPG